jgi:hypothetical protein
LSQLKFAHRDSPNPYGGEPVMQQTRADGARGINDLEDSMVEREGPLLNE